MPAPTIDQLRRKVLLQDKKINALAKRVSSLEGSQPEQEQEEEPVVEEQSTEKENPTSLFKVFGVVGAIMIILGVVYFYKYAVDQGWIGITGRIALGIAAGIILIGAGLSFYQRDYGNYAQVLNAVGLGVLYFTIYATYHFTEYRQALGMNLIFNTILLLVIMAGGVIIGMKLNSKVLIYGSLLFSYVAAFLSGISGKTIHILVFVLVIGIFIALMAKLKGWYIGIPAQVLTYIAYSIWFFQGVFRPESILNQTQHPVLITFTFLLAYYAVFTYISFTQAGDKKEGQGMGFSSINTIALAGFGLGVIDKYVPEYNGLYLIMVAVLTLIVGYFAKKKGLMNLFDVHFLGTMGLVALAIPVQFDKTIVTVLWVVMMLALAYSGMRIEHKRLFYLGYIGYLIPICRVLFYDMHFLSNDVERILAVGVTIVGLIIMQLHIIKKFTKKEAEDTALFNFYSVALFIVSSVWIWVETYKLEIFNGIERVSHSVLWALLAIIFIIYGVTRKRKVYNWCGVILFGVVILKVLAFDISALENIVRVLVLIIVGVIALVGSFVFVKNRDIIKEYM